MKHYPRPAGALLAAALCFFITSFFTANLLAQDAEEPPFAEGAQYEVLREVQPVQTGEQIEVADLFWYQCPHCYKLAPYLDRWQKNKPDNAEMVHIPAVFNERWAFSARIYYTLEVLGLVDKLHGKLFDAIHQKKRPMNTQEQFVDWVVAQGSDRKKVMNAFSSFTVESKVNFATVMSRKYRINAVPAIIIDGKYRTSATLAGGHEKLLEVIDYLIDLAAKERAG